MTLVHLLLSFSVSSCLPVHRRLDQTDQGTVDLPPQSSSIKVLIPLYVYPTADSDICTQPEWLAVATAGSAVVAIVNPSNGPVTADHHAYDAYAACMTHLKSSGVSMIGYVPTKIAHEASPGWWVQTGLRPLAAVREMINTWHDVYGSLLDGIFVDEVSNRWSVHQQEAWGDHIAFYLDIFSHARETQPTGPSSPTPARPRPTPSMAPRATRVAAPMSSYTLRDRTVSGTRARQRTRARASSGSLAASTICGRGARAASHRARGAHTCRTGTESTVCAFRRSRARSTPSSER